jgi:hypothetical protein
MPRAEARAMMARDRLVLLVGRCCDEAAIDLDELMG